MCTMKLGETSLRLRVPGFPGAGSGVMEKSRFLRFMTPVSDLSATVLDYLTDLDHVDTFAWGVLVDGRPAAVGRYVKTGPGLAEVALTVLDDFQGQGLGTLLVQTLAVVAAANGLERLEFEVLPENAPMLALVDGMGAERRLSDGVVVATIAAADVPAPPIDPEILVRESRRPPAG